MTRFPLLLTAVSLYLALARVGIHYGLPHEHRPLSYNSDETTWLEALSKIKPGQINPYPKLDHPTFYLEMYGAAVVAARAVGYIPRSADKEFYRQHPEMFGRIYLVGRYLQVVCGVLLLIALWGVTKSIYGLLAADIAALLFSVTPSLIAASHFSQANVPVALIAFLCLGCLLMDDPQQPGLRKWLLSGALACGLAIGTKYSAAPLVIPLAYQLVRHRASPSLWAGAALAVALGFFIGTPFAFLAPRSFWMGFRQLAHENLEPFPGIWPKLSFPFTYSFRFALGGCLELVAILAVLWSGFQRKGPDRLLLLWIVPFFAGVIAAGDIGSSGRVLIIIPALLFLVGRLGSDLVERGLPQKILNIAGGIVLLLTLLPSLALVTLRNDPPIQQRSSQWIRANIPAGSVIGIPRTIYWWSPDVVYASASHPERLKDAYRIPLVLFSKEIMERDRPEYLLVSAQERQLCHGWPDYSARCDEFFEWLDSGRTYQVIQSFPRVVHWRSWQWKRPELPRVFDDDLWTSSLTIYQRKHS